MKLPRFIPLLASLSLAVASEPRLGADAGDAALSPAQAVSALPDAEARQKRAESKAGRLLAPLKIEDAAQATHAKLILIEWLGTLSTWHQTNDPKLNELWTQWSRARAVVPKDEFPAEVIAHQIDDVYASLRPDYLAFIEKLATVLTPEQIDALKEQWSRSPGMKRTYNGYLEIVPDLTEAHKRVIFERMYRAREDAMLTDSDKEIVNIFKRHKVKVEAYVGTLEWAKLHSAFAKRGSAKPAAPSSP